MDSASVSTFNPSRNRRLIDLIDRMEALHFFHFLQYVELELKVETCNIYAIMNTKNLWLEFECLISHHSNNKTTFPTCNPTSQYLNT